jgi:uncharacterized glyoxalase superfamily protein PhnB
MKEANMQTISPYLLYEDVDAAMEFLTRAFGFEEVLRYTGGEGYVSHAEMRIGDGVIYMGDPGDDYRGPAKLGGVTVAIHVNVDDADALYQRAKAAGAEITSAPADQEYGERRFGAKDPEGHSWWFSHQLREVAPEDWGATPAQAS